MVKTRPYSRTLILKYKASRRPLNEDSKNSCAKNTCANSTNMINFLRINSKYIHFLGNRAILTVHNAINTSHASLIMHYSKQETHLNNCR